MGDYANAEVLTTMYLDPFFSATDDRHVRISAEQGSRFAKEIAGDFNPIHNPDAKRFVVPGDLLFSLVLHFYGLSSRMEISFTGMVGAGAELVFPGEREACMDVGDTAGRVYLKVENHGSVITDPQVLEKFARGYVAFSGQTFLQVLVPLMRKHGVMINPDRPLIIYEGMGFSLDSLDFSDARLELSDARLDVNGKRGDVTLEFIICAGTRSVGTGSKRLLLSGLRDFDARAVDSLVRLYGGWKAGHIQGQ